MKKTVLVITIVSIATIFSVTHAQEVDFYKIKSIDPDTSDLQNFSFLKDEIGDAQVVFLGEQDHGDGAAFLAKTTLIKYLVTQMGFTALVFEGDFLTLNDPSSDIEKKWSNLTGVWKNSDQTIALKKFITDSKIEIAGTDVFQLFSTDKFNAIYWQYASNLTNLTETEINQTLPAIFRGTKTDNQIFIEICRIHPMIINQSQGFDKQLFEAFQYVITSYQHLGKKSRSSFEAYKERDTQMGVNLDWLMKNTLRGKKAIVWAANFHIANNPNMIESEKNWGFKSGNLVTMGDKFDELSELSSYRIAITSYKGQYTEWTHSPTYYTNIRPERHAANSLEFWLSKKNVDYAFVPLKNIQSEFALSGFVHKAFTGKWKEVFDAILYINRMTPSTYEQNIKK